MERVQKTLAIVTVNATVTHLQRASHITLELTSQYITYTLAMAS